MKEKSHIQNQTIHHICELLEQTEDNEKALNEVLISLKRASRYPRINNKEKIADSLRSALASQKALNESLEKLKDTLQKHSTKS